LSIYQEKRTMRYFVTIILALLIGNSTSLIAQTKGNTSEIQRVESGNYSFAKGEVQVVFVDTVSPGFVEKQLKLLGYEAINLNINRVTAHINGETDMEVLAKIEQNPEVYSIEVSQTSIPERALQDMFERDSLTVEEQQAVRKRFESMEQQKFVRVYFQYHINHEKATAFLESYPGIDFRISMAPVKSGRVKTQVGKEEEVMKSLERLIYVESTAFVGIME